jgi:replicative DNA helicase
MDDIKGSGSIKQISFDIIGFARDMANENEDVRNTINFIVLKSRFTGKTGPAGHAKYDHDTTRLTYHNPQEIDFEVL